MSIQDNEQFPQNILEAYHAVNQHWSHAEQERWQILYNFLTANSILILAWVAVFSSSPFHKRIGVLITLSVVGVIISALWLAIVCRVNLFIKQYGQLGEMVEKQLYLNNLGSFHAAEKIRKGIWVSEEKGKIGWTDRIGRFVTSSCFVIVVPIIFTAIYIGIRSGG